MSITSTIVHLHCVKNNMPKKQIEKEIFPQHTIVLIHVFQDAKMMFLGRIFFLYLLFVFSNGIFPLQCVGISATDIVGAVIESPSSNCYQIVSLLGSGDEAIVYLSHDKNGRKVALKRIFAKELLQGSHPELSLHEFQVSRHLDHPNIIKIEECFSSMTNEIREVYLVMEYVAGNTLRMTEKNSHSSEKALQNVYCFLDIIRYLAEHHLFYSDLHTSNLMFDDANRIKLIDLSGLHAWPQGGMSAILFRQYLRQITDSMIEIMECGRFSNEKKVLKHAAICELEKSCMAMGANGCRIEDLMLFLDQAKEGALDLLDFAFHEIN